MLQRSLGYLEATISLFIDIITFHTGDLWRGSNRNIFLVSNLVSPKEGSSFFKIMSLFDTVSKMDLRVSLLLLT